MDTNFFGALAVTRAALPHFRARKGGAIVNVSSMGGQMSFAGCGAYSASKFALEGMSAALAHELRHSASVMIVEPGALRTNFSTPEAIKQMPVMPAYQDIVGSIRALMNDMDGKQDGDPAKAARALDLALQADNPPLRLQVGVDAIGAVRAHAEHLLSDLAAWEKVGADVRVTRTRPPTRGRLRSIVRRATRLEPLVKKRGRGTAPAVSFLRTGFSARATTGWCSVLISRKAGSTSCSSTGG